MSQGFSLTAFAGHIKVSRDAVYDWIRAHAEFSNAVKIGQTSRLTFLEKKLLNSNGKDTIASIFALKNAGPDEWQDRRYTEQTVHVKADLLTTDQLRAIAAGSDPLLIDVTPGAPIATPDATPSDEVIDIPNPFSDKQSQEDGN